MPSHRILQLNALATAGCAAGMLATRGSLHLHFGLGSPALLDTLAIGLLAYAGALAAAAWRQPVGRQILMAFTAGDVIWVVASAVVLVLFWGQLAPLGRALIIAVALIVEAFATMQYRAAGRIMGASGGHA